MKIIIGQKRFFKIEKFFKKNNIHYYTNGFAIEDSHFIVIETNPEILGLIDEFLNDFERVSYPSMNTFLKVGEAFMYVPHKRKHFSKSGNNRRTNEIDK
jgi:hypothetical protein